MAFCEFIPVNCYLRNMLSNRLITLNMLVLAGLMSSCVTFSPPVPMQTEIRNQGQGAISLQTGSSGFGGFLAYSPIEHLSLFTNAYSSYGSLDSYQGSANNYANKTSYVDFGAGFYTNSSDKVRFELLLAGGIGQADERQNNWLNDINSAFNVASLPYEFHSNFQQFSIQTNLHLLDDKDFGLIFSLRGFGRKLYKYSSNVTPLALSTKKGSVFTGTELALSMRIHLYKGLSAIGSAGASYTQHRHESPYGTVPYFRFGFAYTFKNLSGNSSN
jgi:hypothetical protein